MTMTKAEQLNLVNNERIFVSTQKFELSNKESNYVTGFLSTFGLLLVLLGLAFSQRELVPLLLWFLAIIGVFGGISIIQIGSLYSKIGAVSKQLERIDNVMRSLVDAEGPISNDVFQIWWRSFQSTEGLKRLK